MQVASGEDGAGWAAFFRDLTARGLSGVQLVTSDAHAGLVAAIGATLPDASWQRCRTHHAANLMSATPKSSWPCGFGRCCTASTTSPTPARHTPSTAGSSTNRPRQVWFDAYHTPSRGTGRSRRRSGSIRLASTSAAEGPQRPQAWRRMRADAVGLS